MGYLVHYNMLTDRLEGKRFIESSSLSEQSRQTKDGFMYAKHAFIETGSLTKEIQFSIGGDVRSRAVYEIKEPNDLPGLVLWLKSSSGISHSLVTIPPLNPYESVNKWTPVVGSGSYITQSGTGTIGPFTYTLTPPTFAPSASVLAPDSYPVVWFMGLSGMGNLNPAILRNSTISDQSVPFTLMVKFDGNLTTGNGGAPVFAPSVSNITGSTGDGAGYVRPGFFYPYIGAETDVPQLSQFRATSVQTFDFAQTWTADSNSIVRCWDSLNPLSQFTSSISSISLKTIGSWFPYPIRWIVATGISEICIWNRVLTDIEIRDMNTSYFYPRYKGVLAVQP